MAGGGIMEERFWSAIMDYVCTAPVLLISLGCMFFSGRLLQMIIFGFTDKLKKYDGIRYALPIGAGCSCIALVFQNLCDIVGSSFTLEMLEIKVLSSSLLSFSVVGIVAAIVLPIREFRQKKGTKQDGKKS